MRKHARSFSFNLTVQRVRPKRKLRLARRAQIWSKSVGLFSKWKHAEGRTCIHIIQDAKTYTILSGGVDAPAAATQNQSLPSMFVRWFYD